MLRSLKKLLRLPTNKYSNDLKIFSIFLTQQHKSYAQLQEINDYSHGDKNQNYQKKSEKFWNSNKIMKIIALLICLTPLKKCQCQQNPKNEEFQVQVIQIDKVQLVNLVHSRQECLIMAFNKYEKNNQKEFTKQISAAYNACKQAKVKNIFLVDKNDIKQLQKFSKWLKQEKEENLQNLKDKKCQYFYLNPQFQSFPFFIQSTKTMLDQIRQIKSYQVKINSTEYLKDFEIFNRTTVIKQCPNFVNLLSQNPCVTSFKREISQIIQLSLLRKKSQQFKFYVITPTNSNKLSVQAFHSELKSRLQQLKKDQASNFFTMNIQTSGLNQKKQDTVIFRYDLLGKNIQLMSEWLQTNKNLGKSYKKQQKFLHFIKPRIFTISKTNYTTDLYWYVTCNRKSTTPTISIRNIDQMKTYYTRINHLLKRAKQSQQYPLNYDLEMLRFLHKNHPNLNYLIINTSIVAQLIRHLWSENKYVIFNLSSKVPYQKLYLPNLDYQITIEENYQKFKPLIQKFIDYPKVHDYVTMDKEHQIGRDELLKIMQNKSENVILRVCYNKCLDSLKVSNSQKKEQLLKRLYKGSEMSQKIQKQTPQIQKCQRRKMNKIYQKCYRINSQINNVGLQDGDYIFEDGIFKQMKE